MSYDIYGDIVKRTNGDIYIGVVGPVRTGKSTFIASFMEKLILPNIEDKNVRTRAIDELPQAADGKTIMTTQPKFVPAQAVNLRFDKTSASVRLIDCVGYLIEGVQGHFENDRERNVKTPWSEDEMTFTQAAALGTHKVITEHSTIAVLVTTDGSITGIPRGNYIEAEERVVNELKKINKPFVVLLNTKTPEAPDTVRTAEALEERYGVKVMPADVKNMDKEKIDRLLQLILDEFPIRKLSIKIPKWMRILEADNHLISALIESVRNSARKMERMKDARLIFSAMGENENFNAPLLNEINMGKGEITYEVNPKPELFLRTLSDVAKVNIEDDVSLISFVKQLSASREQFEIVKEALRDAEDTGYGIVIPLLNDMELEPPMINKSGNRYGVKLSAKAASYHIIKVQVSAEVNPIVGTEQQSQYMLQEFENDPQRLWNMNMFGKTLSTLVQEDLKEKLHEMPLALQAKLSKTITRIVNEKKNNLFCILI